MFGEGHGSAAARIPTRIVFAPDRQRKVLISMMFAAGGFEQSVSEPPFGETTVDDVNSGPVQNRIADTRILRPRFMTR